LLSNPFSNVAKADENLDPRRRRRALTEDELHRLLEVARRRPLLDAMTVRRGKHKGEAVAKLGDVTRRRLEKLGWERALIYKTLVLTGLRKSELASLTVGQLVLHGPTPHLVRNAADEKNRKGSTIPLRADLAADLRQWVAEKPQKARGNTLAGALDSTHSETTNSHQADVSGPGREVCLQLSAIAAVATHTPLFTVPAGLVRILDRDLVAAGIARRVEISPNKWKIEKLDERGRTVDVHALRHTFGTLLSKSGVAPRTAQAAMRHADVNLTMNVYTDPKLLDLAAAVETLPALPLGPEVRQSARAQNSLSPNGAEYSSGASLAPTLALTSGKCGQMASIADQIIGEASKQADGESLAVNGLVDKHLRPLSAVDNGRQAERETRLELATSSLGS